MNTVAKRIYNIAPDPVRLTFADGTSVDLSMRSAEFFQEEFQGEAVSRDDPGSMYRIVTAGGENETVMVGRQAEDGWKRVGEVVEVEAIDG